MNREYTCDEFSRVVDTLNKNVDDLQFATDIIVGFPGETQKDFDNTMNLVTK